MKRVRIWFWRSLGNLFAVLSSGAHNRAARVCGCESCRLQYDRPYREQLVRDMVKRALGGTDAPAPDRRPS